MFRNGAVITTETVHNWILIFKSMPSNLKRWVRYITGLSVIAWIKLGFCSVVKVRESLAPQTANIPLILNGVIVRATAVWREVEQNAVLAGDPKLIRLLCNSNLNISMPSRESEEKRIRICLQAWSNILVMDIGK